ncbi:angiopoietin-related protein 7-like [Mercenaria mercenaria]|uniref:angiopoietin-related protein 7-like n=1 Tax=Mercenaria mercenaria TaxID=6596 RepID=UPI00234E45A8|nr:angiopoietin-related protein 7-like [Mercenaria mercenaria]
MGIYMDLVLFLYVHTVLGFSSSQFMERFIYIEDRINAESKFRRDDFSTLFNEIGSVKTMLQQLMENKPEGQDSTRVQATGKAQSELEKKVKLLRNGFKEEKNLNIRFRREIPELQMHVQDLKIKSDQISASLEDILKGIEFLKEEKVERKETFNLFQNKIPEIQKNIIDLHEQFEQTKAAESESLHTIKTGTEKMKENIDHLKHSQEQCLESIDINNNITKRLEEKLVSGKMISSMAKDSYDEQECNCSVLSCPLTSTPSPDNLITTFPKVTTYESCLDLYDNGFKSDAIYKIEINHTHTISVYCDMTTDGGGWTVFQRRKDGSVDFFQGWNDYKTGFGNLDGEFWLGNEYLNLLTDNGEPHELRIELGDHDGNHAFAKYSSFKVGSESTNFQLEMSGYTGNAGDSLETSSRRSRFKHNGMKFSTKDMDNDKYSGNCAAYFKGAWWFNNCFDSHLNAPYQDGIIWYTWKGSKSLKYTEMKFR